MSRLKYACAIIFLNLIICNSQTVDIFDLGRLDESGKAAFVGKVGDSTDFKNANIHGALRIGGLRNSKLRRSHIFEDFVISMMDLLSGFPGRMLSKYCRVVYRELDRLEFKYTRKLAKHFRELSRMDRDEFRDEMQEYQQELQKKTPQLEAFMEEMNNLFTMEQGVKFSDYVFDVRDYGNLDKRDVGEETRALLDSIMKAVRNLSFREQNRLEQKLRRALREHNKGTGPQDIYSILFYESTPSNNPYL